MDGESVREALGLDASFSPWLAELEGVSAQPLTVVPGPAAADALARMKVPTDAAELILSAPPDSDALRWVIEREQAQLVGGRGGGGLLFWPSLPLDAPPAVRSVHAWAFLGALAPVREWHRQHGVSDEVSWATLADVGRNAALHQRILGAPGVDVPWWLTLHFRGAIYELGRLQFERTTRALSVHIPDAGPMSPAACDASFDWARSFFPTHFADEPVDYFTCYSWLLDPQLRDYLSPDSNIVRFQERFTRKPGEGVPDNDGVVRFVFRVVAPYDLDALPQETSLQRAVVSHIRAGGAWRAHAGRFDYRAS